MLIHVSPDFPYIEDVFPPNSKLKYAPAPSLEEAHLVVRSDGDEIVLHPRTGAMLKCGHETRFMLDGKSNHLPYVLNSIAQFADLLEHRNEADPCNGQFTLEMHRLLGEYARRTVDENVGHMGNMVVDGAVRFMSHAGAMYGFTIRNMSSEDLIPHVFFFDPEEYTIQVREFFLYNCTHP